MADDEISVSDNEGEAAFMEKERPLWPQTPSLCTVPKCQKIGLMCSFKDFQDHWNIFHNEMKYHYKCIACRRLFANNKHAKAHTKSRIHKGQSITIKYVTEKNDSYIDPITFLPYQLGSKENRSDMREIQRDIARDNRRKLAENAKDVNIPYSGRNVNRDERVVERQGELYLDSGLWNSPSRRKRTRYSKD